MRLCTLLMVSVLAGCAASEEAGSAATDLAAVRQISMSGRAFSWQELRVHPTLMQRACAVATLVNEDRQVVGYCTGGRQCRTNDWQPVAAGCGEPPQYRATPSGGTPADTPSGPTSAPLDFAGVR